MTSLRPLLLLVSALLALGVSACGQEEVDPGGYQTENAQVAETEGIYLELSEVKYQVQISRQLNPLLVADKNYFDGIAESDLDLADDEVWFGIWMRVENESEEAVETASRFTIVDTQENEYVPVSISEENVFAYKSGIEIGPENLYPDPDSPAGERQPNGALLLYKLKRFSLDNRPLELTIDDPAGGPAGVVNLDV